MNSVNTHANGVSKTKTGDGGEGCGTRVRYVVTKTPPPILVYTSWPKKNETKNASTTQLATYVCSGYNDRLYTNMKTKRSFYFQPE